MHGNNRPGLLSNRLFQLVHVHEQRPRIDIHESWGRATADDGLSRGRKRVRDRDHLVARADADRPERQLQGVGSIRAGDGLGGAAVGGVLFLELPHLFSQDEVGGRENSIDRLLEIASQLLVLGPQAGWKPGVGQDHPRAEPAIVLEDRVFGHEALRMQAYPIPYHDRKLHDGAGANRTVIANAGVFPDQDRMSGLQPRANPRPSVDDRVRTDHTVRADDERILARPSPLRRLAEHAEILYPGAGADQDVRKRAKVWLAQGSLPWSGARGCEPPPALSVHRSRVDALPGCCRRTR